jgi:biopolymer transport protein ExbB
MVENLRNLLDTIGVDWVLWILIGMSVLGLAITLERVLFFRKHYTPADELERMLLEGLDGPGPAGTLERIKALPGMVPHVVTAALREWDRGPDSAEEIVLGALASERNRHDRYLPILGTLGNNAPFIGLLGTVIGIVSAFADLEAGLATSDAAKNEAIMGSISEALVATAVGLFVAIPAVIAFNYFKNATRRRASSAEALSRIVIARMRAREPR